MAKRDIENVIIDLFDYYKANLNTYITAITTEKGDSVTLPTIVDDAFSMMPFNNEALKNYDPIFFLEFVSMTPISIQGRTSSTMNINLGVLSALNKNHDDLTVTKRLLRYSRALRETAEAASRKVEFSDLTVEEIPPFGDFALSDDSELFRAVGVQIMLTFVG